MTVEQWRPVVGYEGLYEVSDQGQIKRVEGRVWNRRGFWITRKEGVLRPGTDSDGYLIVGLCKGGVRKTKKIHQQVLLAFVGSCPSGHQTRHLNGERKDNRLVNLSWGTHAENMADIERHGNRHRGEAHHFYGRRGADHWLASTPRN